MEKEELLSVVVPVYNVEKYVKRCVESISNQTYRNLEIIIVDDGSSDSSGAICDELALHDSRIKVIHKANGGLGSARNAGIDVANGKYITFVDSDDWIEEHAYKEMIVGLQEEKCEVATCARNIVSENGIIKRYYGLEKPIVIDGDEIIKHFLLQDILNMSACDKVFCTYLLKGIRFPTKYASEDIMPVYEILKRTKKVYITGKTLYNYYYREGSLSKSSFSEKDYGIVYYTKQLVSDAYKIYPQLDKYIFYFEMDRVVAYYRILRRSNKVDDDIKIFIKKNVMSIIKSNVFSIKFKSYIIALLLGMDKMIERVYNYTKR